MLTLQTLQSTPHRSKRRLGRGNSSGRGTTAGRGTKGQKARSGSRGGLKLRGLKATFKAIPKAKGFHSIHPKAKVINLATLNQYTEQAEVNLPQHKILGTGELTKALTVRAASFSKSAKMKIEQLGGQAIPCGKQS